jgi:hypothetical protein
VVFSFVGLTMSFKTTKYSCVSNFIK